MFFAHFALFLEGDYKKRFELAQTLRLLICVVSDNHRRNVSLRQRRARCFIGKAIIPLSC